MSLFRIKIVAQLISLDKGGSGSNKTFVNALNGCFSCLDFTWVILKVESVNYSNKRSLKVNFTVRIVLK